MANTVKDPVLGMDVTKEKRPAERFGQSRYDFYSDACQEKFRAQPQD